jgi:hypothetical protein
MPLRSLALLVLGSSLAAQMQWTQLTLATQPPARAGAAIAEDTVRGRVVLFGGFNSNGVLDDTWEWDGTTWTQMQPAAHPSARGGAAIAFDSARNCTILFGGSNTALLADTWQWDGSAWTQLTPPAQPPARGASGHAFDSARGRFVLFGGAGATTQLNDTWEWDGATWTQRLTAIAPVGRTEPAMTFDSVRARTVLFGGGNGNYLADTWEWDGTLWTRRLPFPSPTSRTHLSAAFDRARGRTVLFGGFFNAPLADTWEWDGTTWLLRTLPASPPATELDALVYDGGRRQVLLVHTDGTTWAYTPVHAADAVAFGSGCTGTAGVPSLLPAPGDANLPWLGVTFSLRTDALPNSSYAALWYGLSTRSWNGQPLPLDLAVYGMPGCALLTGVDASSFATGGSSIDWPIAVPNTASLGGVMLWLQSASFDAGANGGVAVSNGVQVVVGGR